MRNVINSFSRATKLDRMVAYDQERPSKYRLLKFMAAEFCKNCSWTIIFWFPYHVCSFFSYSLCVQHFIKDVFQKFFCITPQLIFMLSDAIKCKFPPRHLSSTYFLKVFVFSFNTFELFNVLFSLFSNFCFSSFRFSSTICCEVSILT